MTWFVLSFKNHGGSLHMNWAWCLMILMLLFRWAAMPQIRFSSNHIVGGSMHSSWLIFLIYVDHCWHYFYFLFIFVFVPMMSSTVLYVDDIVSVDTYWFLSNKWEYWQDNSINSCITGIHGLTLATNPLNIFCWEWSYVCLIYIGLICHTDTDNLKFMFGPLFTYLNRWCDKINGGGPSSESVRWMNHHHFQSLCPNYSRVCYMNSFY